MHIDLSPLLTLDAYGIYVLVGSIETLISAVYEAPYLKKQISANYQA
jgi:hypothetical protein